MHKQHCKICFEKLHRRASLFTYFHYRDCICEICRNKMEIEEKWLLVGDLEVFCLYTYNRFMENLLFQFKEGKDVALKDIFLFSYKSKIEKMFKGYTIVYMPSSKEHIKVRGFFPLKEMFEMIDLPKEEVFIKNHTYKQSSLSYLQRKQIRNIMQIKKGCKHKRKKVLLVDDVITSGETILSAYRLLKDDCEEIKALVLCNHYRDVELCDENKFPFHNFLTILKKKVGGVEK